MRNLTTTLTLRSPKADILKLQLSVFIPPFYVVSQKDQVKRLLMDNGKLFGRPSRPAEYQLLNYST